MALRQDFRKVDGAKLAQELADKQLDQFVADEATSGKNPTEIGRMLVSGAAAAFQKIADLAEREAKNSVDDLMFTMLLDQIQQQIADMEARLAEIRRSLADVQAELVEEFGAGFLLRNAEMYLKPDVFARKAGETDEAYEARMQEELEALMLDADGNIKAEYKDLTIAEFVMLKRQERELEQSIDVLKEANVEFEKTGDIVALEKAYEKSSTMSIALANLENESKTVRDFAKSSFGNKLFSNVEEDAAGLDEWGVKPSLK